MVDRDMKAFSNLASKLFVGHLLCPTILSVASEVASYYLNEDDGSELFDNFFATLAVSAAFGPWSGMVLAGQIADSTVRGWAGVESKNFSSVGRLPVAGKIGSLIRNGEKMVESIGNLFTAKDFTKEFKENTRRDLVRFLGGLFPIVKIINAVENVKNQLED
jgi:hypothetical protein